MQFLIFGLVFSFFYKSANAVPNSCGDRAKFGRDWVLLCFSNPDKTLNVTFDCNLNRNQDDVHLRIWYHFYPPEMTSLTIQNCKKLYLAFDIEARKYVQLRHLHVRNISRFAMEKSGNTRCLPQEVKFENMHDTDFSMPLISDDELCKKSNYNSLESLQLINMTIRKLPSNFIWEKMTKPTKLEKFFMQNVQIEDAQKNSIVIQNSTTIDIVNTTVKYMKNDFINVEADVVTIASSTFTNIPPKKTFVIKAEEVHIKGNTLDLLGENTLEISSNNMYLVSNVFHRIEENAFKSIGFSTNEPPRYFNFLNNVIHSLSPRSITSPTEKSVPIDSDFIDVYHNFVVCSCANLRWFEWLARTPSHFNNKWLNENHLNRCLNIPVCDLNQISGNYHNLCEDNYECSEIPDALPEGSVKTSDRVMVNSGENYKPNQTKTGLNEFERLLTSLEKSNNETFQTNFEIIKLLWVESRKIKKN